MEKTIAIPQISPEVLQNLSANLAWHYRVVPKGIENGILKVYISDKSWSLDQGSELEVVLGNKILFEAITDELLNELLATHYRKSKSAISGKRVELKDSDDFLLQIIHEANDIGSSDIHFEVYENLCRIRLRIDGKLMEKFILKREEYPALINKVKIKARLDISEKRLPQDGRIQIDTGNEKFDIRVSVLPTLWGEKIVLRLLSRDATDIDIEKLGFDERQLRDYLSAIKKPHGIVLISGPTGSGKTTTLYASLKILNGVVSNILTIEDPVEYTLEGINQVQLKEDIGLGFSEALRSFLRQDPDIIMLGEIRDQKTAQMAIRAALTGHLVLSTIHTNSAWGTISRLQDMEIPSFLIAGTMNATVAQRLIRLLCQDCKSKISFDRQTWPNSNSAPGIDFHFKAGGCGMCHFTGYRGRKALYEVIPIDVELSEKIRSGTPDIDGYLKKKGIKKISAQAEETFTKGLTSLEEIHNLLLE